VVALRWVDVDLAGGWWTIPAEHVKNKLPRRVPLSAPAVKVLQGPRAAAPKDTVDVFVGIRGTRQQRRALEALPLAKVRPHDFRRTAASLIWNDRLSSAGGSCGKRFCRLPSRGGRVLPRPRRLGSFHGRGRARATKVTDDTGRFDDESR
jgi:hypothetical protein